MSDEIIWTYTTRVVLESNGSADVTVNAFQAAGDDTLESGVHLDYPWADFVLTCSFGGSVGAGKFVRLYRQSLNIDGANDAPVPAAIHERLFMGSFVIPEGAAGSVWCFPLTDRKLIADQQYSIENKTDQTISANWELKATPKTYKAELWIGINSSHLDSKCADDGVHTIEDALDGTGYWRHDLSHTHWVVLDLGASYNITKVRGRSNTNYDPIDVDIFVSETNGDWGAAVASNITTWQDTAAWVEIDTTDKTGRYIRIEGIDTENVDNELLFGAIPSFSIFDAYGVAI